MPTMIPFEGLVVSIWDPTDDNVTKLHKNVERLPRIKPSGLRMVGCAYFVFELRDIGEIKKSLKTALSQNYKFHSIVIIDNLVLYIFLVKYLIPEDTKVSGTINNWSGRAAFKDTDAVFGFHLGLGFNYNITPKLFIGAEGKYLWVRQARLRDDTPGIPVALDAKPRMDGILATAVMGFRF